jgi:hypothetical protein
MISCGFLRMSVVAITAAGMTLSARLSDGSSPPSGAVSFAAEYDRVLKTYAAYKGYPEQTLAEIEARLSPDRLTVLHSIVRAGLTDLRPGRPLITLVDQVQGIWGARPESEDGRHQFRLSVVLKRGVRRILDRSSTFQLGVGGHVLMPLPTGGDDDPAFTGFQVRRARTWRQVADRPPRLQVSQLRSDETVGEIDIDFDEGPCHQRPSNSDPGSMKVQTNHHHMSMLNRRFTSSTDLTAACQNWTSHCRRRYTTPYCQ